MGDEINVSNDSPDGAVSRRNALKAGVAVGVGAAVWSGVSITSLGGTPAYAAGCTNVVIIDLTGDTGCRNTSQGQCENGNNFYYALHPLKNTGLPTGFSLTNNFAEGTCCTTTPTPVFGIPSGWSCRVYLELSLASQGKCDSTPHLSIPFPPIEDPPATGAVNLDIPLGCYMDVKPNNAFYTIYAKCVTSGSDPEQCGGV